MAVNDNEQCAAQEKHSIVLEHSDSRRDRKENRSSARDWLYSSTTMKRQRKGRLWSVPRSRKGTSCGKTSLARNSEGTAAQTSKRHCRDRLLGGRSNKSTAEFVSTRVESSAQSNTKKNSCWFEASAGIRYIDARVTSLSSVPSSKLTLYVTLLSSVLTWVIRP